MSEATEPEQGFLSHLVELRSRLLRAMLAVLLVFLALLPFARSLYGWFAQPLLSVLPEGAQMVAIEVASPLLAPLKLSLFVAFALALPYVLYQLWAFVAPGLYRHERRLALPILVSSVLLFYLGCAFAYFVVFPLIFAFFAAMAPEGVAVATDIGRYLDFVLALFLAFGLSFEVPVAIVILVMLGWVSVDQLRRARPYVIVAAFVVGMLLTPPDVFSQTLLAVPICLLYEAGILAARWLSHGAKNSA
ncbi:MAG: Sec-independent protein translocase protein TatC [Lysobacterales bacterium]|jgi:sec-independent protein translocase protein TatC|nr:MAG: Sec-independent protein translocase protein TatC [Xanthomonadales bacterium]